MTRIDAHIHYPGETPAARALLERLDLKLLNICVADDSHGGWRGQVQTYRRRAQESPERFAWCTSFDLPRFDDPGYVAATIATLARDFADGAVACKAWKNLGMEVRTPSGDYFQVDDPLLEPVFSFVADQGKTLLMHIAEPLDCWLPLREGSPHYGYYSKHPEWHFYGRDEVPSHQRLMEARDAVVARHPTLRVVGAHLGSLEYDVDEIAPRFERYPNFAVDLSGRLLDLALQDAGKVRAFFARYADRILLGTDIGPWMKTEASIIHYYQEHYDYLERTDPCTAEGQPVRGIGLAPEILEKVYAANARRWYPGL